MFVINRSAAAVLAPLALLLAAALWSNRDSGPGPAAAQSITASQTTVAQVDTPARKAD
jgi:hypothetical protein